MSVSKVFFSSGHEEWVTPRDLFDKLDAEFHFTLDPCATPENAQCSKFFTKQDDGFSRDWSKDIVFMNPPYGDQLGRWMQKARGESARGATVVCLVPARTSTIWWHTHVEGVANEVRFIKGKLKFSGHKHSAPFPSVIVIFKPSNQIILNG